MKCCICGKEIIGYGNNPWGAMWKTENGNIVEPVYNIDARCCDDCDRRYVIPGRMYKYTQEKKRKGGV